MVRLKQLWDGTLTYDPIYFQFHYGTIKTDYKIIFIDNIEAFNSIMVRLKLSSQLIPASE